MYKIFMVETYSKSFIPHHELARKFDHPQLNKAKQLIPLQTFFHPFTQHQQSCSLKGNCSPQRKLVIRQIFGNSIQDNTFPSRLLSCLTKILPSFWLIDSTCNSTPLSKRGLTLQRQTHQVAIHRIACISA